MELFGIIFLLEIALICTTIKAIFFSDKIGGGKMNNRYLAAVVAMELCMIFLIGFTVLYELVPLVFGAMAMLFKGFETILVAIVIDSLRYNKFISFYK